VSAVGGGTMDRESGRGCSWPVDGGYKGDIQGVMGLLYDFNISPTVCLTAMFEVSTSLCYVNLIV
jgi:hypothetical protein